MNLSLNNATSRHLFIDLTLEYYILRWDFNTELKIPTTGGRNLAVRRQPMDIQMAVRLKKG